MSVVTEVAIDKITKKQRYFIEFMFPCDALKILYKI